jgi:NCS2 family nucleobase:cation symporter-2
VTNPNADADLCDWIREHDNPKVKQVYEKWDGHTHGEFSKRGRS